MNPNQSDFELGIHELENSLTEIRFPKCQGKIKNTYFMGNGSEVNDANAAAGLFLKREFAEIANSNNVPHPPVFVPDTFIFKSVKKEVHRRFYRFV